MIFLRELKLFLQRWAQIPENNESYSSPFFHGISSFSWINILDSPFRILTSRSNRPSEHCTVKVSFGYSLTCLYSSGERTIPQPEFFVFFSRVFSLFDDYHVVMKYCRFSALLKIFSVKSLVFWILKTIKIVHYRKLRQNGNMYVEIHCFLAFMYFYYDSATSPMWIVCEIERRWVGQILFFQLPTSYSSPWLSQWQCALLTRQRDTTKFVPQPRFILLVESGLSSAEPLENPHRNISSYICEMHNSFFFIIFMLPLVANRCTSGCILLRIKSFISEVPVGRVCAVLRWVLSGIARSRSIV